MNFLSLQLIEDRFVSNITEGMEMVQFFAIVKKKIDYDHRGLLGEEYKGVLECLQCPLYAIWFHKSCFRIRFKAFKKLKYVQFAK